MNNRRFKNAKGHKTIREIWLERVKPRLVEIEDLYSNGATIQQVVETVGVSNLVFMELRRSEPELAEAFKRAHERRKETLESEVWRLARGETVSVEEIEIRDKNGELKGTQKKISHPAPYLPAALAYLKQNYGWADNPKVDDAVANALNGEDWTAKISLIPGFSDLRPKSSEADNFRAKLSSPEVSPLARRESDGSSSPQDLQGTDPNPEGSGPDDASDCVAGDENAPKEGDDDDTGE